MSALRATAGRIPGQAWPLAFIAAATPLCAIAAAILPWWLVVFAVCVIAAAMCSPVWLAGPLVAVAAFSDVDLGPLRSPHVAAAGLTLALLIRPHLWRFQVEQLLFGGIGALYVGSYVMFGGSRETTVLVMTAALAGVGGVVIGRNMTARDAYRALTWFAVGAAALGAATLLVRFEWWDAPEGWLHTSWQSQGVLVTRLAGPFGDPNFLALPLVTSAVFLVGRFGIGMRPGNLAALALLALLLVAIALTQSRAGVLGLGAGILLLFGAMRTRRAVILVAAGAALVLAPFALRGFSTGLRPGIWAEAVRRGVAQPLGSGPGATVSDIGVQTGLGTGLPETIYRTFTAHNTVLQAMLDAGWIAAALVVVLGGRAVLVGLRDGGQSPVRARVVRILLAGSVALMVQAMFVSPVISASWAYFFLGVLFGFEYGARQAPRPDGATMAPTGRWGARA